MTLPCPSAEAQRASGALVARIRDEILARDHHVESEEAKEPL